MSLLSLELETGRDACDHPSYRSAFRSFSDIALATGVLSPTITREPNEAEREELWRIARAFITRIYALDIDPDVRPSERDHLAHFAIVALHWCDIYIGDARHRMDNGRFRRDTLALALCLYCRIEPDYPWHQKLTQYWIAPHVNFSFLMWTIHGIVQCHTDNYFGRFSPEEAEAAHRRKLELVAPDEAYIPSDREPPESPLHRIWIAVRDAVLGPEGPCRFALRYIWNGPGLPGGIGLLPDDREMNKAYLQRILEGGTVPNPPDASVGAPYLSHPAYPGAWYQPNDHWSSTGNTLHIMNFPNVFDDGAVEQATLFRKFTRAEVEVIVQKIRRTETLILLPFVSRILQSRFDLRGMRVPFWFIPFVAYGNDRGGVLYFEENGIYSNHESPERLGSTGHCDRWNVLSVEAGYNGLNWSDADDDILTSLRIEATAASGQHREFNVVEFHGPDHGATLHIVQAIWETVWQPVVERSRHTQAFLKGPPPWPKAFESWDDLLAWANAPDPTDDA